MRISTLLASLLALTFLGLSAEVRGEDSHADLIELFAKWREFERPPMLDGAPDSSSLAPASKRNGLTANRTSPGGAEGLGSPAAQP